MVLVVGDDWEGIYIDGTLATEGHEVTARDAFASLGIVSVTVTPDQRWLCREGCLPSALENVKLEKA